MKMKKIGCNVSVATDRLRMLRKTKGLTIRQLAEGAAVSNPYLSQLENGVVPMGHLSYERAERLAAALGIDVKKLMEGHDVA